MCYKFYLLFLLSILISSGIKASASPGVYLIQDTVSGKQVLYNGRIWRNIYYNKVRGDQFLFSDKFLPGSVTINGRTFENVSLRYDIHNDEIMIITCNNNILQLNKEMVDRFSMKFDNTIHNFINIEDDSLTFLNGYSDLLHDGKTALYVRYTKEIQRLKEGRILENFIQVQKTYIVKDGTVTIIKKKKELMKLLSDNMQQVRSYIKSNKIRISKTSPQSLVPVLKFYDSFGQ